MIEFRNISKWYGRVQALKDVTVSIAPGKITAILGPNGSGKTTLLKSLLGLVHPDRGEIFVLDERINAHPEYRQKIGYMPQIAQFPEHLTVREIIQMMKDIRRDVQQYDEDLFERFQLARELDKKSKELSGGTRQKLNAYLAFLFRPQIYVLDEPTVGLDPVASLMLKEKIRQEKQAGKTIIFTSHILPEIATLADDVIFLLDGKLLFKEEKHILIQRTGTQNLEEAVAEILQHRSGQWETPSK